MKDIFVSNLIKIYFPCVLGVGAMAEVTSIVSLVKDHLERVTWGCFNLFLNKRSSSFHAVHQVKESKKKWEENMAVGTLCLRLASPSVE